MSEWIRLCSVGEAPTEGNVCEMTAGGLQVCVVKIEGAVRVMDNLCPHRQGPLGQGWVENGEVVCPWHSWAFSPTTGQASFPEGEKVAVFPVRLDGDDIMVEIG